MRTISFKLPESLDVMLAAVAATSGATKSAVAREALQSFLGKAKAVRPGSCLALARDLVGSVEGPPDLSYHKKHMQGFGK